MRGGGVMGADELYEEIMRLHREMLKKLSEATISTYARKNIKEDIYLDVTSATL
jgi:hypothetical protein